jgi:hypothetical protein
MRGHNYPKIKADGIYFWNDDFNDYTNKCPKNALRNDDGILRCDDNYPS